jgi:pilus assembly protein Flp/PilA
MAHRIGPDTMIPGCNTPDLKGNHMKNLITRFQNDESGATAIEYGLIAGLVSVVIIAAITLVGSELVVVFDKIQIALPGNSTAAA